jgi:protein-disulfide isomerase/uncharacterized membrane protein
MLPKLSTGLPGIAYLYAKSLLIPVTESSLRQRLEEHSYYPSLLSLSNVFDRLQIPNQSFSIDEGQVDQLEAPFVAFMKGQRYGDDFVLVTHFSGDSVSYSVDIDKTKTISKQEFFANWKKIVFVAEKTEKSGERGYAEKHKIEVKQKRKKTIMAATAVAIFCLTILLFSFSTAMVPFAALSILLVKFGGVAAAVLLLIYDMDKNNSFIKSFCTVGKQINCDAVLNSNASKIMGMSWGEAGFFYFASTTLFLLSPFASLAVKFTWLAVANIIAAPYILFSVYYQWRVVKQWCPLCLTVQAILALELGWSIFNFWSNPALPAINATIISAVLLAVMVPMIIWFAAKPSLISLKENSGYKAAYKRLLYSPEIFNGLLQQQNAIVEGYDELGITIGNPNALNTIVKVCNPYCGWCAKAHPELEEILSHTDNVKIKIIFTATNDEGDRAGKVVRHLLAIEANGNAKLTQQALNDWYLASKKDYENFAAKYPKNGELKKQYNKIDAMSGWCKEAGIIHTPTIFINGKQLPENYKVEELKYIF